MSGFQSPITIFEAIKSINGGTYVLPSFQREFLWKREQIENLFDSLMRDYPTGSMLIWKIEGNQPHGQKFYKFLNDYVFDCRNYPNKNEEYRHIEKKDYYAILDGQQRLTAMRIGVMGYSYSVHEKNKTKDYSQQSFPNARLYLKLSLNSQNEYECKYTFRFLKDEETQQQRIYSINDEKWFYVKEIVEIHQRENLDDYLDEINSNKEERTILRRLERLVFDDKIINYYLEDSQDADKALNIFIRINSGGSPLSFSDIVFSLIVGHWNRVDARTSFKDLTTSIANKGFRIDKDYIIKAFLVLFSKEIKTSANNFPADFCLKIENEWKKIELSIETLFSLLKNYSLTESTLTSMNATLPILYYIYHKNLFGRSNIATTKKYDVDRKIIQSWLFKMIVLKPFGAHTDSPLLQARKALGFYYDASTDTYTFIDDSLASFPADSIMTSISSLQTADDEYISELLETQKDNVYAFSILALLFPQLEYNSSSNYHKDHMHPDASYEELPQEIKVRVPYKRYNSIVNLQMLDLNENTSKKEKCLKDWVDDSTKGMNLATKKSFYENHIIPFDVDLELSNVEEFFNEREKILSKKLKDILNY